MSPADPTRPAGGPSGRSDHDHSGHDHDHSGHDHAAHDHGDDHAGHDHGDHDHAAAPAEARAIDPARYEGVDGWVIRSTSDCGRELVVQLPYERFSRIVEAEARSLARRVTMRGFRPGKAPPSRVKSLYADEIRERAVKQIVQEVWEEASAKETLRPVANPSLTEVSIQDGAPVRFTATFEVLPDIELTGLAEVPSTPKSVKVSEREVEEEVETLRLMRAELLPSPSQEATPGDFAVVDLVRWGGGASEGDAPAESREGLLVEVGHEKNLPEIDRALLGMASGDTRAFTASGRGEGAPPEAPAEDMRFKLTLKEVRKRKLPDLDDAFAKSLGGGWETLAALRDDVRGRLKERARDAARREQEAEVIDHLVARNPFTVPPSLVEQETEARIRHGVRDLVSRGVDVENASIDWKAEFDRVRVGAERDLRADYLLELAARARGVEVAEADVQREIEVLARSRGEAVAAVRAELEKSNTISHLRASLRRRRTLDLLRSNATISVE